MKLTKKEIHGKVSGQQSLHSSHVHNVGSTLKWVVAWHFQLVSIGGVFYYPSLPPSPYFSTDLFSVTIPPCSSTDLVSVMGVWAACRGSWLGCGDYLPWEWYFSSWAQAPNPHKAIQLLSAQEHYVAYLWTHQTKTCCCWRSLPNDGSEVLGECL